VLLHASLCAFGRTAPRRAFFGGPGTLFRARYLAELDEPVGASGRGSLQSVALFLIVISNGKRPRVIVLVAFFFSQGGRTHGASH
jgi:hypothetical protein